MKTGAISYISWCLLGLLTTLLITASPSTEARSAKAVRSFKYHNPCPSTDKRQGACPGWEVDHIKPLCLGGEDKPDNMQWLTVAQHRAKTRQDLRTCRMHRAGKPKS